MASPHEEFMKLFADFKMPEMPDMSAFAEAQKRNIEALTAEMMLAAEKAGFAPAALTGFVAASPTATLARLASPATWQLALIAAAVVAAVAVSLTVSPNRATMPSHISQKTR